MLRTYHPVTMPLYRHQRPSKFLRHSTSAFFNLGRLEWFLLVSVYASTGLVSSYSQRLYTASSVLPVKIMSSNGDE